MDEQAPSQRYIASSQVDQKLGQLKASIAKQEVKLEKLSEKQEQSVARLETKIDGAVDLILAHIRLFCSASA